MRHSRISTLFVPVRLMLAGALLCAGAVLPVGAAAAAGPVKEYDVGGAKDHPEGIALGADGNIWLTHRDGNRISKVTPNGKVTDFPLPRGGNPARIVAGPDDAMWFTEYSGNRIGRITPDGEITEYEIPTPYAGPLGIARQKDTLWFTESRVDRLGRISVRTDGDPGSRPKVEITEYDLGRGAEPLEVAAGPDGRPWFTMAGPNAVGRLVDGKPEVFPLSDADSGVGGIAPGPNGRGMWFTQPRAGRLGWIDVDDPDTVVEFPVRPGTAVETGTVHPAQIVAGPDDAMWFTAPRSGMILRAEAGAKGDLSVRGFPVPTRDGAPFAVTLGPGKDLWFTERAAGRVGRIAPASKAAGVTGLELTVGPAAAAAGHERTRTENLPASALADTAQLQGGPWRATPWRTIPLGVTPWRTIPLEDAPWRTIGLDPVPLSALPLRGTTWTEVLVGTIYEGVPLQTVTVGQVLALEPVPPAAQALTMADINLDESPWRTISLAGLLLARVSLDDLPPPEGGSWCAFLAGRPSHCGNGVDPTVTTLLDLELAGDDLSDYYSSQIDLVQVGFAGSNAPLTGFALTDIMLTRTPLGRLPTTAVPTLVTCPPEECATLADAQAADALEPAATVGTVLGLLPAGGLSALGLGDLLAGIVDGSEIGYEDGPLSVVLDHALIREHDLLEYRVGFTVDCDEVSGLEIDLTPAERFRALPGSARIETADGKVIGVSDPREGTGAENTLRFQPPTGSGGVCAGAVPGDAFGGALVVDVEPGATLGTYPTQVTASTALDRSAGLEAAAGPAAPATVDDSHDAGADVDSAQRLRPDDLAAGHLTGTGDVDLYAVEAPGAGSVLQVSLSHLPADYDLVVYGPSAAIPSTPWRTIPWRTIPWRTIPVEDGSGQAATDGDDIAPSGVQDVPILDLPLRATSIRRGTATESVHIPVLDSDRDGRFIIQVSGYNDAYDVEPYILRANVEPGPPPLPCRKRTFTGNGTPGTFPSLPLPAATKTLILVDAERTGDLYGNAATAAMLGKLHAYAARPDVAGVVVPVESGPGGEVREATDAWDADPCSPSAANAVVGEVNEVVDHIRQGLTELRSIVLVGSDEVLPMGRVPDLVNEGNEKEYIEAAVGGMDTAVSRALAGGLLLSDDPYGDFDPQTWLNGNLYVPDVALGRLVETPEDISAQLDQYAAADGILAPDSADVFGYDFLVDGSQAIGSALADQVPTTTRTDNGWTSADALAAINRDKPGYLAVNAHYNHFGALPANSYATGDADILYSTDADPAPRSVLFTVGCHAGLNLPDIAVAVPTAEEEARLTDWAQVSASRSALFTGNTGYGYGDTEVVGYSERLLHHYAGGLAGADVTAGQALLFAKQRYIGELGVIGVYDAKVSQQVVFYGLPTYRINEDGGEGAPILPQPSTAGGSPQQDKQQDKQEEESRTREASFSVDPSPRQVETDRGTYWTVPGHLPQVTHFRPVEPRLSLDVTGEDGLRAHGALIEELESVDIGDVDPVYSRPTIDLSANEPEPSVDSVAFPSQLQTVNELNGPEGRQDRLVLIAGQTLAGEGEHARQRLFGHIAGTVYRSDSGDWSPPRVQVVDGFVVEDVVVFSTRTADGDVERGVVMYRDDSGPEWKKAELRQVDKGNWSVAAPLADGATTVTEFFVQLVDGAGNVAVSSNKGARFEAGDSDPSEGEVGFEMAPPRPDSGYYRQSPKITLGGLADREGVQVAVDGGAWFDYEGGFTVSGDGVHVLEARDDGVALAFGYVAIDSTPPEVTGSLEPAPNQAGWSNEPVTVFWRCADDGSGVASCPEPVPVRAEGRDRAATGTATDRAGNSATGRVGGINLDLSPPVATFDPPPPVLHVGGTLTGTAVDALSGLRRLSVTYTPVLLGRAETVPATLSCSDAGRSCHWSVPTPETNGIYLVTATATDVAANRDGTPPALLVRVLG